MGSPAAVASAAVTSSRPLPSTAAAIASMVGAISSGSRSSAFTTGKHPMPFAMSLRKVRSSRVQLPACSARSSAASSSAV